MKSFVVDTNALVRYILDDIPEQVDVFEALLKRARDGKVELHLPQIVIFEIEFILRKFYGVSKEKVIDNLESLLGMDYFQIQDRETLQNGLRLFSENNLSFVDCFLYSLAEKENAELFTFDKKLEKLK